MLKFLKDLFTADKYTIDSLNKTINKLTEHFSDKQQTSFFPTKKVIINIINEHINKCQNLHSDIDEQLEEMKENGEIRYIDGEGYHGRDEKDKWT